MTLPETLLALALRLHAPTTPEAASLRAEVVSDVLSVTIDPHRAAELLIWSFFESRWKVDALGDGGASCGVMQTFAPHRWVEGATCAAVRASRRLSYRVGLAIFTFALDRCKGSVRGAWGLYATGSQCAASLPLVARRCALAGC